MASMIIEKIGQAVRDYATAHDAMGTLVIGGEADWRYRYLAIRQQMNSFVSIFHDLAHELDKTALPPSLLKDYKARLSRMRHLIALHQADWPVVAIDPSDTAYKESLNCLREAREDFLATAQQVKAALQGRSAV